MAHLTRSKREQLSILHRLGKSQEEIAGLIGTTQPTVSRELRRNNSHHPRFWYDGEKAHMCAEQRGRGIPHQNPRYVEQIDGTAVQAM